MAFPDPTSITPAIAGATSLPKVNDNDGGLYRLVTATHLYQLRIRQSVMKNGNRRWNVEIIIKTFATETAAEKVEKVYAVREAAESNLDQEAATALGAFISDTGKLTRLSNGEM